MAVSDSDYAGSFVIPSPKGIYQADGDTNMSLAYAYEAQNIRTERGLMASAYGARRDARPWRADGDAGALYQKEQAG